ncbi:MAG TPA: carboxypeptidase-like regulatory domain-containing protein, partial [Lunatimonas sp.]|nr:carboxypeptidase-like regulatory domain-containing protein [Lunatimonas sp.]
MKKYLLRLWTPISQRLHLAFFVVVLTMNGVAATPTDLHQNAIDIRGKVTDAAGQPIPGATVVVEGTNIGTVTNIDGEFSLNVG